MCASEIKLTHELLDKQKIKLAGIRESVMEEISNTENFMPTLFANESEKTRCIACGWRESRSS